jgi:hypothetical protein
VALIERSRTAFPFRRDATEEVFAMRASTILTSLTCVAFGLGAFACGSDGPSSGPGAAAGPAVGSAAQSADTAVSCSSAEECTPSPAVQRLTGAKSYRLLAGEGDGSFTLTALGDGNRRLFAVSLATSRGGVDLSYVDDATGEKLVAHSSDGSTLDDEPEISRTVPGEEFNRRFGTVLTDFVGALDAASHKRPINTELGTTCVLQAAVCAASVVYSANRCQALCIAAESGWGIAACISCVVVAGGGITAACQKWAASCCTPIGCVANTCGTEWNGCLGTLQCNNCAEYTINGVCDNGTCCSANECTVATCGKTINRGCGLGNVTCPACTGGGSSGGGSSGGSSGGTCNNNTCESRCTDTCGNPSGCNGYGCPTTDPCNGQPVTGTCNNGACVYSAVCGPTCNPDDCVYGECCDGECCYE